MADPNLYTYPDPLEGYENLEPLSEEPNPKDGKSVVNPPSKEKSAAYSKFPGPITNEPEQAGFDIHIYFIQNDEVQATFARKLRERIRREFPELRVYKLWERPLGPHPVGMFEVNLFSPAQFGAFVSWLVINRGPLSALVHPNTGEAMRDHTQRATWLGTPYPLNLSFLR